MYGSLKSVVVALTIVVGSLTVNASAEAGGYGHGGYGHGGYRHGGYHHHHHHHGYNRGYGPAYVGVPVVAVAPPVVYPAPAPSGFSFSISNGAFGFSANPYQPPYGAVPYNGAPYIVRP